MNETLRRKVLDILFEQDAMNIIHMATQANFVPYIGMHDEYAPEGERIISRLPICSSIEVLEKIIITVYEEMFGGNDIPLERHRLTARAIWNCWEEYQGKTPTPFPDDVVPPPRKDATILTVDVDEDDKD